jgi:hypothetical protein
MEYKKTERLMDHSNMIYNSDIRINNPLYLMKQVEYLIKFGFENRNSSSIIYACLESRISLELLDLEKIKLSVNEKDRIEIIEESKPKNGIEKIGKNIGVLKERYQLFFQAICEVCLLEFKHYDFKKSKDLQNNLSKYIHSYYMNDSELEFDSQNIQDAILLIKDVDEFIRNSCFEKNGILFNGGIEIKSLKKEDQELLNKWKNNIKMNYKELKLELENNIESRKK